MSCSIRFVGLSCLAVILSGCAQTYTQPKADVAHATVHISDAESLFGAMGGNTTIAVDQVNGKSPTNIWKKEKLRIEPGTTELLVTAVEDDFFAACKLNFFAAAGEFYQISQAPIEGSAEGGAYLIRLADAQNEKISECEAERQERRVITLPNPM